MIKLGFPKTRKPDEQRIPLIPKDIRKIRHLDNISIERGFGHIYVSDREFSECGVRIAETDAVYSAPAICQFKFHRNDLPNVKEGQIIFGAFHLGPDEEITRALCEKKATCIAMEHLRDEEGSNLNWKIFYETGWQAMSEVEQKNLLGRDALIAVIGRGNVGRGTIDWLREHGYEEKPIGGHGKGHFHIYHSGNSEALGQNIQKYDVIVNAAKTIKTVLEATDLRNMKNGALIVHIGSDCIDIALGSPHPQLSRIFFINNGNNLAYWSNNVTSTIYDRMSAILSEIMSQFYDAIIDGTWRKNGILHGAIIIDRGEKNLELLSLPD